MVIYFIPFLTGVNLSLDQFSQLFENEKIIGVKFSNGDFFLMERLRKAYPNHLIYAGLDEMMLSAAVLDVDGGIGSTYNINGIRAKQIYTLAKAGKIKEAREIQQTTNDLIEGILANGLYQTIKEIMKTQGVDAGYCRQPTKRLSEEGIIAARELAEKYL